MLVIGTQIHLINDWLDSYRIPFDKFLMSNYPELWRRNYASLIKGLFVYLLVLLIVLSLFLAVFNLNGYDKVQLSFSPFFIFFVIAFLNLMVLAWLDDDNREKNSLREFIFFYNYKEEYLVLLLNLLFIGSTILVSVGIWLLSFSFIEYSYSNQNVSEVFDFEENRNLILGEYYFLIEYDQLDEKAANYFFQDTIFIDYSSFSSFRKFEFDKVLDSFELQDSLNYIFPDIQDYSYSELLSFYKNSKNLSVFRKNRTEIKKAF